MIDTLKKGPYGHHASNLGGLLAREIGSALHIPSYIVDPPWWMSWRLWPATPATPSSPAAAFFHALNQKAVAKRFAKEHGKKYEELNLIVCHMGGGVSVGAHVKGEVVDTGNALEGEGPFSPERSGTLPSGALVDLCFSGKYTEQEIRRMITGNGGLLAYTGSTDMQELMRRAATDAKVQEVIDAFHYRVAKEIGAMAAAMKGQVDQIILTGGIAHGQGDGGRPEGLRQLDRTGDGVPRRGRAAGAGGGRSAGAARRGDRQNLRISLLIPDTGSAALPQTPCFYMHSDGLSIALFITNQPFVSNSDRLCQSRCGGGGIPIECRCCNMPCRYRQAGKWN